MRHSIAKLCAGSKQHFAQPFPHIAAMGKLSLNRLLAVNLKREMKARGLNERSLGAMADVAPNTVGNYTEDAPSFTSKGKERSADLAVVERIAGALRINPLALLTDHDDEWPPLSQPEVALINNCRRLAPDRLEKVVFLAEALLPPGASTEPQAGPRPDAPSTTPPAAPEKPAA
jgi:transcriptional regulator with XRE-family HTH domain